MRGANNNIIECCLKWSAIGELSYVLELLSTNDRPGVLSLTELFSLRKSYLICFVAIETMQARDKVLRTAVFIQV